MNKITIPQEIIEYVKKENDYVSRFIIPVEKTIKTIVLVMSLPVLVTIPIFFIPGSIRHIAVVKLLLFSWALCSSLSFFMWKSERQEAILDRKNMTVSIRTRGSLRNCKVLDAKQLSPCIETIERPQGVNPKQFTLKDKKTNISYFELVPKASSSFDQNNQADAIREFYINFFLNPQQKEYMKHELDNI
ncbi:MAG: hypothetical protein GF401_05265 [Chitinivibrionales bacterium]|nr:hypothetical protein [Chitinivibrionales bacterium]